MTYLSKDIESLKIIPTNMKCKVQMLEDIAYLSSCFLTALKENNFGDAEQWKHRLSLAIETYENIVFSDNITNTYDMHNICCINHDPIIDNLFFIWQIKTTSDPDIMSVEYMDPQLNFSKINVATSMEIAQSKNINFYFTISSTK